MKCGTIFCLMDLYCSSHTSFLCDGSYRFLSPDLANAFYKAIYNCYPMLNPFNNLNFFMICSGESDNNSMVVQYTLLPLFAIQIYIKFTSSWYYNIRKLDMSCSSFFPTTNFSYKVKAYGHCRNLKFGKLSIKYDRHHGLLGGYLWIVYKLYINYWLFHLSQFSDQSRERRELGQD